jgi:hypothetical protein
MQHPGGLLSCMQHTAIDRCTPCLLAALSGHIEGPFKACVAHTLFVLPGYAAHVLLI